MKSFWSSFLQKACGVWGKAPRPCVPEETAQEGRKKSRWDFSRWGSPLPRRALVASGDRSAPTEAGAETGRWARPTGAQRPLAGGSPSGTKSQGKTAPSCPCPTAQSARRPLASATAVGHGKGVGFANLPPAEQTGVDIPNPAHEGGEKGV